MPRGNCGLLSKKKHDCTINLRFSAYSAHTGIINTTYYVGTSTYIVYEVQWLNKSKYVPRHSRHSLMRGFEVEETLEVCGVVSR